MPKYYIKTGTLEIIFSTDKEPYDACRRVFMMQMKLMSIVMSVGTGTILLLTQPRM